MLPIHMLPCAVYPNAASIVCLRYSINHGAAGGVKILQNPLPLLYLSLLHNTHPDIDPNMTKRDI